MRYISFNDYFDKYSEDFEEEFFKFIDKKSFPSMNFNINYLIIFLLKFLL